MCYCTVWFVAVHDKNAATRPLFCIYGIAVRQFFFNVAKTPYGYYRPILLKNFEKDFVNNDKNAATRPLFCIYGIAICESRNVI